VAVTADDVAATLEALATALRDQLSSYKLPRHLFPIAPGEVPFLTSQKPDRLQLAALASRLTADAESN
jgi:acyl-CoA synthetase (AMP-forming)/AMP-acid ligase II